MQVIRRHVRKDNAIEERVATKVDPLQLAVVAHSRQKGLHLKISDHNVYAFNFKGFLDPAFGWQIYLLA